MATKCKAKITTTFDFLDGNGPVPAHRHPNGGGWVADTATVDSSEFVGPDAKVFGEAQVYGKARVSDSALVSGSARVYGEARVFGSALVFHSARVYDEARVFHSALVYDEARVYGSAGVYGSAWVANKSKVTDTTQIVTGMARGRSGTYQFTLVRGGGFVWGCRKGDSVRAWIESQKDKSYGPATDAARLIALETTLNLSNGD